MGLRIIRAKKLKNPPEPIYAQMIRGILKPVHPVLNFNILQMNCKTTIDFEVSAHVDGGVPLLGTFAGFWFERIQSENQQFDIPEQLKLFEQYVFKCVVRYLDQVLGKDTAWERKGIRLISEGEIDWEKVKWYFHLLVSPLSNFEACAGEQEGVLRLVINPKADAEFKIRPWASDAGGFVMEELQEQIRGIDAPEEKLKQYLIDQTVKALYGMRFNLDA